MVSLLFDRDDCADEAGCLISPAELAWKDAVESGEVEQTGECLQETYDRSALSCAHACTYMYMYVAGPGGYVELLPSIRRSHPILMSLRVHA